MRARPPPAAGRSRLRIVGGRWRGRSVEFRDAPGLRPTPDRVRETLFNWLQPAIVDSRCLDLFAGSGALGFEALSRGAAAVAMLENAPAVAALLRENAARLGADGAEIVEADALGWLRARTAGRRFDIVFVDPPYRQGLAGAAMGLLHAGGLLADGARVYVESAADEPAPPVPPGWHLHRDKRAGQVAYRLYLAGVGAG